MAVRMERWKWKCLRPRMISRGSSVRPSRWYLHCHAVRQSNERNEPECRVGLKSGPQVARILQAS